MSKIAVIIVNWNTGPLLADCVESLVRLPDRDLIDSIHIMDNASVDQSVAQLKSRLKDMPLRIHIVQSRHNLGFAAANNQAVAAVSSHDTHILLLNPDTVVHPGALTALLEQLASQARAGIVGPQLHNPDGSLQPSVRRFPSWLILAAFALKLGRLLPKTPFGRKYLALDTDYQQSQSVDQVMGAAFFIRREVWDAVGPLDEKFWVWFEEVDYCRRVKDAGYEVWYTPRGIITHYGAASFSQLQGWQRTWAFIRSALHYAAKHLGIVSTISLLVLLPLTILLVLPTSLATPRRPL